MNKKERFMNAIQGKPVDRVPVSFYAQLPFLVDNGVSNYVNWVKNTNMDGICIEADNFYTLLWPGRLKTMSDWKKLRPFKKDDYYIAGQVDRARRVAEELKGDVAVYYMVFTPFSTMKRTIGTVGYEDVDRQGENSVVMNLWRENKKDFEQVMEVLEESNNLLMDQLKEHSGIDGLFVSVQSGEKWRHTAEEYRKYQTPFDKRLISYAASKYDTNILHLHTFAHDEINYECWKDYEYNTINWRTSNSFGVGLKGGRDYFKPGTTLMGGFDNTPTGILRKGSEKEIKSFTKKLISEAGDEKLILSCDCSLEGNPPDEHLRWVVEASEEYSQEKK